MKNQMQNFMSLIVIGIVFLVLFLNPIYFVKSGEKGVIRRFGVVSPKMVDEGMKIKMPIADEVFLVNVRPQTVDGKTPTYTKDNQPIDIDFKVIYSIPESEAANTIIRFKGDPMTRFASPKIIDAIKAVGGRYTASEFVTKRDQIRKELVITARSAVIDEDTKVPAIKIIDIPIVNVDFDDQYENAIKAKQVAQQEAQKAEYKLQQAKVDAQAAIAKAEGEAKALTIKAKAIAQNPAVVKLNEIEKWDGHYPLGATVIGGGATIVDAARR